MALRSQHGYEVPRNLALFTCYDALPDGSTLNQVKGQSNSVGQRTSGWQEQDGTVSGTWPQLRYACSETSDVAERICSTSIIYTNGKVLNSQQA